MTTPLGNEESRKKPPPWKGGGERAEPYSILKSNRVVDVLERSERQIKETSQPDDQVFTINEDR